MFLHLSVRHSVQGGVWLWVWGCASGLEVYIPPWTHTPLPRDTHIPPPDTPRLSPPPLPPLQSTSRQYLSYWNAFLFVFWGFFLHFHSVKNISQCLRYGGLKVKRSWDFCENDLSANLRTLDRTTVVLNWKVKRPWEHGFSICMRMKMGTGVKDKNCQCDQEGRNKSPYCSQMGR